MDSVVRMQAYPPGFIKDVRHQIATVIANYKAHHVPAVCRRYGLADGEGTEAFSSKYTYVSKRLIELPQEEVLSVAGKVAQEEGDAELITLLKSINPPAPPTTGAPVKRGRVYYSLRTGKHPTGGRLTLEQLKHLYESELDRWSVEGYRQEHFGFFCVDDGEVTGKLGRDINARMLKSLGKDHLWPIDIWITNYTEDDLFDVIEFMHDHISKPVSGRFHSYSNCGMHYDIFDTTAGQTEYRASVNQLLARYADGFELSETGEVLELGPNGTAPLLATAIPATDDNVKGRVESAVVKFRRYRSTEAERRDAVRDLADVLEYLRPQVKEVLTKKDEGALFAIANEFGIRHHNTAQKTDYDHAIWLSWMFYFYLATIHACVRMIDKAKI